MAKYKLNQEEYDLLFNIAAKSNQPWVHLNKCESDNTYYVEDSVDEDLWHEILYDTIVKDKNLWEHITNRDDAITIYMILMGLMNPERPEWNQTVGKLALEIQKHIDNNM